MLLQARPTAMGRGEQTHNFLSPLFPWVQAAALWANWFLLCQLPPRGIVALVLYALGAVFQYACYGVRNSVGNHSGWSHILVGARAATADGEHTNGNDRRSGSSLNESSSALGSSTEVRVLQNRGDEAYAPLLHSASTAGMDSKVEEGRRSSSSNGTKSAPASADALTSIPAGGQSAQSALREELVRRRPSDVAR